MSYPVFEGLTNPNINWLSNPHNHWECGQLQFQETQHVMQQMSLGAPYMNPDVGMA